MQQALRQPYVVPKEVPRKSKQVKSKQKNNTFSIVMVLIVLFFALAIGRVVQFAIYNQFALRNDTLIQKISNADQEKQELSSRKLALESPQRIESIAINKLKMIKATNIRYIAYNEPASAPKVAMATAKSNSNVQFKDF